ncbi:MAG: SLOG family protein [Oscillospiraceae bacterium]|nr:SLOG family protein [Oscillospiraceae bacterium]
MKSCAFTGHRLQKLPCGGDEDHPSIIKLKNELLHQVERLYLQRGITEFYAGGAVGTDQWAAEAVLSLRKKHSDIHLHIIVPFRRQSERFTSEQKRRYEKSCKKADTVVILQEDYSDNCFFIRNDYLVERGDVLIAVYDRASKARSGTGYTVNRAIAKNRNIIFINPQTAEISYHIGYAGGNNS